MYFKTNTFSLLARIKIVRSSFFSTSTALYGLKQSPKALISFGYEKNNVDHTMFHKHYYDKVVILIMYVGKIAVIGNDSKEYPFWNAIWLRKICAYPV